jgi:hypothetical protein
MHFIFCNVVQLDDTQKERDHWTAPSSNWTGPPSHSAKTKQSALLQLVLEITSLSYLDCVYKFVKADRLHAMVSHFVNVSQTL